MYERSAVLTWDDKDEIVRLYEKEHLSLSQIAGKYGKSRQGIYKVLRREGVDTSKATGCRVRVVCGYCEKPLDILRSKNRRGRYHFCDSDCYTGFLRVGAELCRRRYVHELLCIINSFDFSE